MAKLPRPGIIGILIRLIMAGLVGFMGYGALIAPGDFWDGFDDPLGALPYLIGLTLFTSVVTNELTQRAWGWKPTIVMLMGMGVAIGYGALSSTPFGPPFGIYLWLWILAFSLLLAPAFLLAAILRTPGCEMRSYAHLRTKLRGGDVEAVVCPGWVDRFDHVRLGGRL